ncbi:ABC transporter substrate-binding protein [Iamia sp. SCSIO 61187]|uniref:ABC transporter substrate-binding protein n=1 Tax=Iamia sp. SCSIO 61187 TaxID=2722752 RepID=UPI001C638E5D|nr:ABC transporter substrate-binding protein [Iamia sp. SCSIO 61187]QYG94023.1 ABC transporter substrate-binding protein [Iamia sp. SCSIO 61187]
MTTARRRRQLLALPLAAVLLLAGCGGGKADRTSGPGEGDDPGDPVWGGSVTYGLEAETGAGWCLPEAQLAISGIMVARAIYDPLLAPTADGEYVPYLAEAVEHDDDHMVWTITVRDGITFHDGSPLTAEVVKNNLDANRGAPGDHARSPLLGLFIYEAIESVEVSGERDVVVTMKEPWVGFDAVLAGGGRNGILAQAQLDDPDSCSTDLIGTGPFMLEDPSDWVEGRSFRAVRNPDYWQDAPDGKPYPYLDEIIFEPIVEPEQRVNALLSDDIQIGHFGTPADLIELRGETEAGELASIESNANGEVGFWQLNSAAPPLDDVRIRRAMALAIDRDAYADTVNQGEFQMATGPFAPGSPAHLEDTGYPVEQDLDEARRLVAEHVAERGPIRTLTYQNTPSAASQELSVFFQQSMAEIGIDVALETVQQDTLIDNAIAGDFDLMAFRNYASIDPGELYSWFRGQSPVNFGRFDDAEINRLLDAGRIESDPEARAEIYRDLNRRMGEQAYSLWTNYATWMVASSPAVHGYDAETAPDLPGGHRPSEGLASGHVTHGLWRTDG